MAETDPFCYDCRSVLLHFRRCCDWGSLLQSHVVLLEEATPGAFVAFSPKLGDRIALMLLRQRNVERT